MNNRSAIFSLLLPLLFSANAYSFTANGTVKSGEIIWDNVFQITTDELTLSDWSTVAGLTPTTQWSPGMAVNSSGSTITLTGASDSVEVSFGVKGMQYNTGGANPTKTSPFLSAGQCADGDFDGSIASVTDSSGSQCSAPYSLVNDGRVAPFYFYRPIFDIDTDALATALQDLPAGNYTGSVPLSISYFYISAGGAYTYYQTTESLSFQITNIPSYLTSIEVTNGNTDTSYGLGQMKVDYDTSTYTASGSTIFDVRAQGYFSQGLALDIETPQNDFILTGTETGTTIPFSVSCSTCDDQSLVADGNIQNGTTQITGSNVTDPEDFTFQIEASINNVSAGDVESDSYSGGFTIIFEEVM